MNHYDFAVSLAERAGEELMHLRDQYTVHHKGTDERDIVTSADLALNSFFLNEIKQAFPDHSFFSEEGGVADPDKEYAWAIDPIDGTANFSRGIPHFSTCVGLMKRGVPILGVVYNPITRDLFSFEEGRGAFCNGVPIHTSEITEPGKAQGLLVVGHQPPLWDWGAAVYRDCLEHLQKLKALGSSGLDLCFLASGRADVVIYGTLTTLDVASAIGILRAAGGELYTLSGEPAALTPGRQTVVGTANRALFESIHPLLHPELLPH